MRRLTELEVYQYCIDEIKNTVCFPFICTLIDELVDNEQISDEFACKLKRKVQDRNNIPDELKNERYIKDSSAIWSISEREMRVKYLEYLMSKL